MDLELEDKVIIVTGGAGRPGSIGRTVAEHIAEEGGISVLIDKHPRGKDVVQLFEEKDYNAEFIQADLTTPEGCETAIQKAVDQFGRIDGLVNNLGINDGVGLNGSYEQFIASLKLNLVHFFAITKAARPWLKKSKGSIVNITSKLALTGQGGTSGYAASKGGVLALTREWALDLRNDGIRVNALVIAESWTPAYKKWIKKFDNPEAKRESIKAKIPLEQRMTKPSEIADTVLFLLSNRASHITGQYIHVDGGYVHLDRAAT